MGAWGIGPFENDDAADFLGDLVDSSEPGPLIATALADATDATGDLDSPEASIAIAAAAVVAMSRTGEELDGIDEDEAGEIAALSFTPTGADALASAAISALDRVVADGSELLGLWDEAGEATRWRATLDPIRAALTA